MPIINLNDGSKRKEDSPAKEMKSLAEQWSESMQKIGKELDELPGRLADALERRLNLVSAVIALFAVLAVLIFLLGFAHGINNY